MPDLAPITPPPATRDPELGDLLQLMRVVDVERQQRDLALQELSADEQRKRLHAELEKVYAAEGAHVSPAEIDAAIEAHYANRFTFKPPPRTPGYRLLWIYTQRNRLALIVGVPLLCVALVAGIFAVAIISAQHERARAAQSQVVAQLELFYQAVHQVRTDLEIASGKLAERQEKAQFFPGFTDIRANLRRGEESLRGTDAFLLRHCPQGSAKQSVSPGDVAETASELARERPKLETARRELAAAGTALSSVDDLLSTLHSLTSLMEEIGRSSPPKLMLDKAELAYRTGKSELELGNGVAGKSSVAALARLKQDLAQLKNLQAEAVQLATAIAAIAAEDPVKERSAKLAKTISSAVAVGDLSAAGRAVEQLRDLRSAVEETFTLRLVERPGVKTGVARTVKAKLGASDRQNLQLYYLIVEAVTPSNQVLTKSILNEETQQSSRVTMWAERVPRELYEEIKAEKQKTGRVLKKNLMTKERGYLTATPVRLPQREGQLTKWND